MPAYSWRRRPTAHFGDVWVPYAHIQIQAPDGRWRSLAVQVDSGAVVSLLRRSAADLLGVVPESGRQIGLSSVGGGHAVAYVHVLHMRFDQDHSAFLEVPFAVAHSEQVPNLLGRLGVFDRLQVDSDGTLAETSFSAPWLDDAQCRIWKAYCEFDADILRRWQPRSLPPPAPGVVVGFLNRAGQLLAGVAGLVKLHRTLAAVPLLRSLFELSLQLEYLMRDPASRAQRYVDYTRVTRHRLACAWTEPPEGDISTTIANRASDADRARVKREYESTRNGFLSPKGKLWDKWYCMSVRDLAKAVDQEAEYKRWYATWSAWSHGDPFALRRLRALQPKEAMLHCYRLYGRMLLRMADNMVLGAEQYRCLRMISQPFT